MKWICLLLAIVFEVSGTTLMKFSQGFTKVGFSIGMFVCYLASLSVLSLAIKQLDTSTAYAIWSGLGLTLITIIGLFFFKEAFSITKVVSMLLIIVGIVGLKLSGVE